MSTDFGADFGADFGLLGPVVVRIAPVDLAPIDFIGERRLQTLAKLQNPARVGESVGICVNVGDGLIPGSHQVMTVTDPAGGITMLAYPLAFIGEVEVSTSLGRFAAGTYVMGLLGTVTQVGVYSVTMRDALDLRTGHFQVFPIQ